MSNPFDRLSFFLQEYIYKNNWTELKEVQAEAIEAVLNTESDILIAASTASGKTEAAFLPIITKLSKSKVNTVFALYIAPIKALINDQFERLNDLLQDSEIPVFHWHGDIGASAKQRFLEKPTPILQITPESLESFLLRDGTDIGKLFGELEFIIIDEAHIFMQNDRGLQVLTQIERIQRLIKNAPRRIGLSATLGDLEQAKRWLSCGSKSDEVIIITDEGTKRKIRLLLEDYEREEEALSAAMFKFIYKSSINVKTLVFVNQRKTAELTASVLRSIAASNNTPDFYGIHHGNISAEIRHISEEKIKSEQQTVTVATVTMELGIDVGRLERVIQIESPNSVASFLQRLGRSGRRDSPPEMLIVTSHRTDDNFFLARLPWEMLKTIAIIELYLEDKWIEPFVIRKYPFSLLYHQTMSILKANTEMSAKDLAREVLTLAVFRSITKEDYKLLLEALIENEHIQKTEEGKLIIGLKGERLVNSFKFYAVFKEKEEIPVMSGSEKIGVIDEMPEIGEIFLLAGRTWKTCEVRNSTVFAEPTEGSANVYMKGSMVDIHGRIPSKMCEIIRSDKIYAYLKPAAIEQLKNVRLLNKRLHFAEQAVLAIGADCYAIVPWLGSKQFLKLRLKLKFFGMRIVTELNPFYLIVETDLSASMIMSKINAVVPYELLLKNYKGLSRDKFDDYIPDKLLLKSFIDTFLT